MPVATCAHCPRPAKYSKCRLCERCYQRWRRAGRPDITLGPPFIRCSTAADAVDGRREDYTYLRDCGLTIAAAAAQVGVCERTGWRYEAARRQEAAA